MSSVVIAGDTSGTITLDAPAVAGTTVLTLPATSGTVLTSASATVGANGITFSDGSTQTAAASPFSLKNRIINGDMVIDQRNNGASVTPANGAYTIDRWYVAQTATASRFSVQQNAGAVTPPAGFTNYLGATSLSAYSVAATDQYALRQLIEGFNVADLAYGTASAATITLSFWVRSSLTGTFGGALYNQANDKSYVFSYTISAANTWQRISITVPGDTATALATNNSASLLINLSIGYGTTFSRSFTGTWVSGFFGSVTGATSVVGTNGATFYITGVQLERNTTATPFEWLPISTELALCQRYYWKFTGPSFAGVCAGYSNSTTGGNFIIKYPVTMRAAPTFSNGGLSINNTAGNYAVTSVASGYAGTDTAFTSITVASGLTAGQGCIMTINSAGTGFLDGTSEL